MLIVHLGLQNFEQRTAEACDHAVVLGQLAAGVFTAVPARKRGDTQHLRMIDQRLVEVRLARNRELPHHLLAFGHALHLVERVGQHQRFGLDAAVALQAHFGFQDRDEALIQNFEAEIHLLADIVGDALLIGFMDDRAHLRAEHAQFLGPRAVFRQRRHLFHQLHAVFGVVHALVDLQKRHDAAARQQGGNGRAVFRTTLHRLFEQDRADDPPVGKAGRFDDAAAHLVNPGEHLLVAVPLAILDTIGLQCLRGGTAGLVQRCDKALPVTHARGHLFEIHKSVLTIRGCIRMQKPLAIPFPSGKAVGGFVQIRAGRR